MKHFYQFFLYGALYVVSACAPMQHQTQNTGDDTVELPQKSTYSQYELPYAMTRYGELDMAAIMSNENVIVFPIDGTVDARRTEFPEYRGVMENTTAGGYTVFDPSVTVYAVEGGSVQRPSYLPEYSVPKYVQARPTAPQPMIQGNGQLMPVALTQSRDDEIVAEPLDGMTSKPSPRAPRLTRAGQVSEPMMDTQKQGVPQQSSGRRSPPMLTGY